MKLSPVWIVGFTGHRRITNPEGVRRLLDELLHSLARSVPGQLAGYSSIAIGGDTIFAEACLGLKIPWLALLPFAEADFSSDFTDADWEKAQALLSRAARVETMPGKRDRNLSYLECGLGTVDEADMLIAFWDGEPSRGVGGTADVVAHARALGKPLVLVHPERLTVAREGFDSAQFVDPVLDYLNELPNECQQPHKLTTSRKEQLEQFFRKVDKAAARVAPQFRRCVAASVILNTLAAVLTAASVGFNIRSTSLNAVNFLLLGVALLAVAAVKRTRAHENWIRCRVAAEICRWALSTWQLGDIATPFWFGHLEAFRRLVKSIRLLRLQTTSPAEISLADCRRNYIVHRIEDQMAYFKRRTSRIRLALLSLTLSFWIFSLMGIGVSIFSSFFTASPSHPIQADAIQSFLPIVLPAAAGCAISLISIFDLGRQLTNSREMQSLLAQARSRVERCENLPSLRRVVESTENAFAAEFLEWFTMFRLPRFN